MGSRGGDRRRRWVVEEDIGGGGGCEKIGGGVFRRRRWVVEEEIGGGDGGYGQLMVVYHNTHHFHQLCLTVTCLNIGNCDV